ncbi:hypothetical protein RVF87_12625 [Gordonia hydrophobica]|uniref:Uncharacterized protein n=1 Tax=Gordonia hydrophobica TaxID=40516 RepID=A0ABZ2TXR9_9ACTN|nr:hypothetical protein [Gordonia hydrophobica]
MARDPLRVTIGGGEPGTGELSSDRPVLSRDMRDSRDLSNDSRDACDRDDVPPDRAFHSHFVESGRGSKSELWLILLAMITVLLLLQAYILGVPCCPPSSSGSA